MELRPGLEVEAAWRRDGGVEPGRWSVLDSWLVLSGREERLLLSGAPC